ncbi:MAG TPA: hypothetical protein PLY11_13415 [Syntrophorhabdus sp.]|nr:hypothetical protein [Syntrophorhabdus sp.]
MMQGLRRRIRYYSSFLNQELLAIYCGTCFKKNLSLFDHLDAAAQWICRAQDEAGDGGVARSYSLIYNPYFNLKGWVSSYPETTGYIIPTMFDYAHLTGSHEIHERAVRMAQWESDIQMQSGAVQGGVIGDRPTPAVFNTGQVIFGWLRAFEETGDEQFLDSAEKAGGYLLSCQERDGSWRRSLSYFVSDKMPFFSYNTRTAWALFLLGERLGKKTFTDAAIRNVEFTLTHQLENGWFKNNCLTNPNEPLMHTIAYCTRGILEVGTLLGEKRYILHSQKTADTLLQKQRRDGSLPGRFNAEWKPAVDWSCLTGNAQISIVWGRLYQETKAPGYLNGMKRMNEYLRKHQLICKSNRNLHGGILGSFPVHGSYGAFEILNWAVKFFMDALIMENSLMEKIGQE